MPSPYVNYHPHRFLVPSPGFRVDQQQQHHDLSTIGEVSHEGASTIADDNSICSSTIITDILDMQSSKNNNIHQETNNSNNNALDKSGEAVTASFSHDSSEDGEFWPCSPPSSPARIHQTAAGPMVSTRRDYPIAPPTVSSSRTNKEEAKESNNDDNIDKHDDEETREVPRWLRLFVVGCLVLVVLSVVVIAIAGAKMMKYHRNPADNNVSSATASNNSQTPVGEDFVGNHVYGSSNNSPPQPQPAENGDEHTVSDPANETSTISLHTSNSTITTSQVNEAPPSSSSSSLVVATPVPESSPTLPDDDDEEDKEEVDMEAIANAANPDDNHQGQEQQSPAWPPSPNAVPHDDEINVKKEGSRRLRLRRRLGDDDPTRART